MKLIMKSKAVCEIRPFHTYQLRSESLHNIANLVTNNDGLIFKCTHIHQPAHLVAKLMPDFLFKHFKCTEYIVNVLWRSARILPLSFRNVNKLRIAKKVSYISRESWVLCVLLYSLMIWTNTRMHHYPILCFAHHTTPLSSLCRPIWRYWTSIMLVKYILSRVRVNSPNSRSCNIWGCVYSAYHFHLWWLSDYVHITFSTSSNRKCD